MHAINFLEDRIDWVQGEIDEAFERLEKTQSYIDSKVASLEELQAERSQIRTALNK